MILLISCERRIFSPHGNDLLWIKDKYICCNKEIDKLIISNNHYRSEVYRLENNEDFLSILTIPKDNNYQVVMMTEQDTIASYNRFLKKYAPVQDNFQMIMYNIGQGDCFYIQHGQINILIDGGYGSFGHYSWQGEGMLGISDLLSDVDTIDYVFESHHDMDHWGGLQDLKDQGVIFLNYYNNKDSNLTEGTFLDLDSLISLRILSDHLNNNEDENNRSLIFNLSYQDLDICFTGDAEKDVLESIALYKNIDILKVAHHGSKYSFSNIFYERIDPEVALISAGEGNPYGHPFSNHQEYFKKHHIPYYISFQTKHLQLLSSGKQLQIYPLDL